MKNALAWTLTTGVVIFLCILVVVTGLTSKLAEYEDKEAQRIYAQVTLTRALTDAEAQRAIDWRRDLMTVVTLIEVTGWADLLIGAVLMLVAIVVYNKVSMS